MKRVLRSVFLIQAVVFGLAGLCHVRALLNGWPVYTAHVYNGVALLFLAGVSLGVALTCPPDAPRPMGQREA